MRKLLRVTTLATAMILATPALADDAAPPPAPIVQVDAAPAPAGAGFGTGSAVTPAPSSSTEPAPTVAEQLEAVKKAFDAYKAEHESNTKKLLLFALIAVVCNLIMTGLKSVTALGGDRGKKWIPVIMLGMGVVVGLFSSLGAGQSVGAAVLYGAGPPLSVFLHELLNLFRGAAPATS